MISSISAFSLLLLCFASCIFTSHAQSDTTAHVQVSWSTVIDTNIDNAWNYLGSFANVTWIPIVETSKMVAGANNQIGGVRAVLLQGGFTSLEQLTAYSLTDHSYEYTILNITAGAFPGPLVNYFGRMMCVSVQDTSQTFWLYSIETDTAEDTRQAVQTALQDALKTIMAAVKQVFAN